MNFNEVIKYEVETNIKLNRPDKYKLNSQTQLTLVIFTLEICFI